MIVAAVLKTKYCSPWKVSLYSMDNRESIIRGKKPYSDNSEQISPGGSRPLPLASGSSVTPSEEAQGPGN